LRVEHDRQGHHRSEAPACHRCGVPLMVDARFCPYCERWLDEGGLIRILRRGRSPGEGGWAELFSERALLTLGTVFFALVAAISIAAAILT
jgi:hypothetical protein